MVAHVGLIILPPILRKRKCFSAWIESLEIPLNSVVHDALLADQLKAIEMHEL
jgi:hypothetical protein